MNFVIFESIFIPVVHFNWSNYILASPVFHFYKSRTNARVSPISEERSFFPTEAKRSSPSKEKTWGTTERFFYHFHFGLTFNASAEAFRSAEPTKRHSHLNIYDVWIGPKYLDSVITIHSKRTPLPNNLCARGRSLSFAHINHKLRSRI